MLDTTPTAVDSALAHARRTVASRVGELSQQRTIRALGDQAVRDLVARYTDALESGRVEDILALLTDDAEWSMPPSAACFPGHQAIAGFLADGPLRHRWRHLPTSLNAQRAVACYCWDDSAGQYRAHVIDVLTVRDDRIAAVTAFIDPSLFDVLGLPAALSSEVSS
ncbi:nuclear transport factor 2 family protein [Gordonia sp. PKS22-38]|uniref:Nuclear transport factor 2 family protein n=1 Tax=Gordonia prachuapensis TaxID=3115651 RepID=A0ABU7MY73_9ACTN|nr:nuclear transport factor 2 family protein [Gordonia sp. PKS22-38]